MSKSTKTLILAGFLCTCMMAMNVVSYAAATKESDTDKTAKTTASSKKTWKNTSPSKVKESIQKYNMALSKQDAVNYNNLFKLSTLNKTQRAQYEKYTANYKTSIKLAKESMSFYMEDLTDLISSREYSAEDKAKEAEDIQTRARNDYREVVSASQTYLRNCAYAMPTLTYQKFLKGFESNYYLGQLDTTEFSTMK